MIFVAESGIAAIAIDPVTTMAVAVAAAMAAVMLRMRALSREWEHSHDSKACLRQNGVRVLSRLIADGGAGLAGSLDGT